MDRVGSGLTQVLLLYYSACNFRGSLFSIANGSNVIHRGKIYRGFLAHVSLEAVIEHELVHCPPKSERENCNSCDKYDLVSVQTTSPISP